MKFCYLHLQVIPNIHSIDFIQMKRRRLRFIAGIFLLATVSFSAVAVEAYPYPVRYMQPDSTSVMLRTHGDEFQNYITTSDGYAVICDQQGYYRYAEISDGELKAGRYIARDERLRTETERSYLSSIGRNLVKPSPTAEAERVKANIDYQVGGISKSFDQNSFRGLVILAQFKDRKFIREDAYDIFNNMINQSGYTGFRNGIEDVVYTGSVVDYYNAGSSGSFAPAFDVVGPVDIDYNQTDIRQTTNAQSIVKAVCNAADPLVDYAQYDGDKDGTVDMIYIIFAGGGSNVGGNNTYYVWPHASTLLYTRLDGVSMGRYACSTEFYGREDSKVIDGIGTICHEFSHVLGLPDMYDVTYGAVSTKGLHPQTWSVMSAGSYLNRSRTPCTYSLYERYALGWANPVVIEHPGNYELPALLENNVGYRINSAVDKEFFLIENRQKTSWDAALAGHGMLIFRVDQTNPTAWNNNKVNTDASHLYYQLFRSAGKQQNGCYVDSDADPYPGSGNVTSVTNKTEPSLLSYSKLKTPFTISDITESAGVVAFNIEQDTLKRVTEGFEQMPLSEGTTSLQGLFSRWNLKDAAVMAVEDNIGSGNKVVGLLKNSELTMLDPVNAEVSMVSFGLWNPTAKSAILRFYYSVNNGTSWEIASALNGSQYLTLGAGESTKAVYNLNLTTPSLFKISLFSGSTTQHVRLDDFTLGYENGDVFVTGTDDITNNADSGFICVAYDDRLDIYTTELNVPVYIYAVDGRQVYMISNVEEQNRVVLPGKGVYLVRQGVRSKAVVN